VKTALKSLLFLILVPGVIVGVIPPFLLFTGPYMETGFLVYIALPLWVIGGAVILWCFWQFFSEGDGTPAPIDPPKELVATGIYKYVRNPMYVGVILMLFAEFLWLGYWYLFLYMILFFIVVHIFVTRYEEPTLKKKFGKSYSKYLEAVPRWIPKFRR
jgi:protein-S-isoprenylcysteine O-methyltransferase Ste14